MSAPSRTAVILLSSSSASQPPDGVCVCVCKWGCYVCVFSLSVYIYVCNRSRGFYIFSLNWTQICLISLWGRMKQLNEENTGRMWLGLLQDQAGRYRKSLLLCFQWGWLGVFGMKSSSFELLLSPSLSSWGTISQSYSPRVWPFPLWSKITSSATWSECLEFFQLRTEPFICQLLIKRKCKYAGEGDPSRVQRLLSDHLDPAEG